MTRHNHLLTAALFFFIVTASTCQQPVVIQSASASGPVESNTINKDQFDLPMHITPVLSGNFGELRNNHFHSGLDFKTNHQTGIPVYAAAAGWVSRIRISANGFGYAIYLGHPNGYTTVYGHLLKYAPPFDSIAKAHQYSIEQFELDTIYKPGQFPVKRGQLIAYSGNSGISAAPHLHFEIRDTKTDETIDPLLWFASRIPDHKAPRIREITLYAMGGKGILKGDLKKKSMQAIQLQDGNWRLRDTLPAAWGNVGLGIKAFDYMDNTSNIYGVCKVTLFEENRPLFTQEISRFSFADTRYINSLIDYEAWQRLRTLTMQSFLDPGNNLPMCKTDASRGIVNLNEEKVYHFRYEISDRYGNATSLQFNLRGERLPIPVSQTTGVVSMKYWQPNTFKNQDIELMIPPGTLYDDLDFKFKQEASNHYSDIFYLQDRFTPLHQAISIKVRIKKDSLPLKSGYYLAKQDNYGRFWYVANGEYLNGWLVTRIREFGNYTIMVDTIPPKITPLYLENAVKNRLFRIRVTDNASGIKSWKGTIDGKWVLFVINPKTAQLSYAFDNSRLERNKQHTLHLSVTDGCGNTSVFEHQFRY
ncbi:MAG: M23 family metallopeptidase [Bacteroidota bacterium]|nr:M23 family metallopeptidase [Bacteroidota bacterium]